MSGDDKVSRERVERAVRLCRSNIQAAEMLNVRPETVYRLCRKYDLPTPAEKAGKSQRRDVCDEPNG
jgi:transposase